MTDTSTPIKRTDPRKVCSNEFFERITNRLLNEHPTFERALAERITEQGLAYLYTAARTRELLSPSPMVDLAWWRPHLPLSVPSGLQARHTDTTVGHGAGSSAK